MMLKFLCLIFFIQSIEFVSAKRLFEGDVCSNFGSPGVCKKFSECPSAIEQVQSQNNFPETCGFVGTVPIVCCTEGEHLQTSSTSRTTTGQVPTTPWTRRTSTTQAPVTPRSSKRPEDYDVGELSDEKCSEYGKYVFEQVRPQILLPGTFTVNQSVCGFKAVELIVGGTPTKPYEFPHQALLGFEGDDGKPNWQCGGALVSENFVISAAHCASSRSFGKVKYVRLGELNITDPDDTDIQDFTVSEIIKHPGYNPPEKYNDIMLLRLDKPAVFNRWVRPTCLHTTFYIPPTNNQSDIPRFLATGWGKMGTFKDTSTILRKVVIDSYDINSCNNQYKGTFQKRTLPNGIIEKSQLCAGGTKEIKLPNDEIEVGDTCQGDSGGPLQIYSDKVYCMYELVGITSFGKDACGVVKVPGVYTRISEYIDWIEKIVWKNIK